MRSITTIFTIIPALFATAALAQVPETLRYQGYLVDPAGQAVDATVQVTFSLYTVDSGGSPQWSDVQNVSPQQGLFSTSLGTPLNPFPSGLFQTPLFLGITVDGDSEMTPRIALVSAPYAQAATDAATVGGVPAAALDQSGAVTVLESDVGQLQSSVTVLSDGLDGAQASIANVADNIDAIQVQVTANDADITQLDSDLSVVESTLPGLQQRVVGGCPFQESIRSIAETGLVTCTSGPWSVEQTRVFIEQGRVGIGTETTFSMLEVVSPVDTDPLRVSGDTGMGLMVHDNRSVTVGTSSDGPDLGLLVAGDAGVGDFSPEARLSLNDDSWQMTLAQNNDANQWYLGASGTTWSAGFNKLLFSPESGSTAAVLALERDGNVGIDTVSPETRLQITGGTDVDLPGGGYLTLGNTTGSNIAIDTNEIMARNNGGTATLALNAQGGRVTFNTDGDKFGDAARFFGRVEFEGTFTSILMSPESTNGGNDSAMFMRPAGFEDGGVGTSSFPFFSTYSRTFFASTSGGFQLYSDRSLKQDIKPIESPLEIVEQLEGVSYALLPHPADDGAREVTPEEQFRLDNQLGFVAQDLERVLPQLVQTEPESGLKTVGYTGVIPVLVEAIKAQQRQIDALKAEVESLRR
ncbi:MAG: tail fiber domain-containing protein [Pseudomonadota bacterium]